MSAVGEALAELRQRFPDAEKAVVAYSGGRDSHVLLHAAVNNAGLPVRALHVAHGLQAAAETWPQHCAVVCKSLGVNLETIHAAVETSGAGQEAAARTARYTAFEHQLQPKEILILAHHADDQAETLMLRLLRGTGLRGLGAMPVQRSVGQGELWRPLLGLNSDCLAAYADKHQLQWVEDPSNSDPQFDRNYLRLNVMPALKSRWSNVATQLGAAARRASEAERLLQQLLEPQLKALCATDGSLSCDGLLAVSSVHQRHLLRAWLAKFCDQPPSESQLRSAQRDVLNARRDADPCLHLYRATLRRHRDHLYWVPDIIVAELKTHDWVELGKPLDLGVEHLSFDSDFGRKLVVPEGSQVQVRFRTGGEHMRLRGGERSLKKLLQDCGVPSWQRYRTPLIYIDDELAAVWNYSVAMKFDKTYKKQ